jgi:hypothetical protein
VNYINLQNLLGPNDYGCDGHPGLTGQQKMAQAAGPVIASVLGWD